MSFLKNKLHPYAKIKFGITVSVNSSGKNAVWVKPNRSDINMYLITFFIYLKLQKLSPDRLDPVLSAL